MDKKYILVLPLFILTSSLCFSQTATSEKMRADLMKPLREKAVKTTISLFNKIKLITNSTSDKDEVNKTIDQACRMFVNENVIVETDLKKKETLKIREYLTQLKLHTQFDKVVVAYSSIAAAPEFVKGKTGSYVGSVAFDQTFEGVINNKVTYKVLSKKKVTVIMMSNSKADKDGASPATWDAYLSDIVNLVNNSSSAIQQSVEVNRPRVIGQDKNKKNAKTDGHVATVKPVDTVKTKVLSPPIVVVHELPPPPPPKPLAPRTTDDQLKEKFEAVISGGSANEEGFRNYLCSKDLNTPLIASDVSVQNNTVVTEETIQSFCRKIYGQKFKIVYLKTTRVYPDCITKFEVVYEKKKGFTLFNKLKKLKL